MALTSHVPNNLFDHLVQSLAPSSLRRWRWPAAAGFTASTLIRSRRFSVIEQRAVTSAWRSRFITLASLFTRPVSCGRIIAALRIVGELERGAAPWIRPWSATAGQNVPQNAVTNRPYSGCNLILLWLARNAAI